MPRNPIGWPEHLARLRGEPIEYALDRFDEPLAAIRDAARLALSLTDAALVARARNLATARRVEGRSSRPAHVVDVFGLVVEVARRRLAQTPFDEQIVAALAMAEGAVVEVQTGEGKTLAATMPAALWALEGRGVHVLTFNDYLAGRDAAWMGPVYDALGLSVATVGGDSRAADRRRAYRADVTYLTAKEAGFDFLRDGCADSRQATVHRPFHAALVDEADSLLIDEARVPLVLAAPSPAEGTVPVGQLSGIVAALAPEVDFTIDETGRHVELTDAGVVRVEHVLGVESLHTDRHAALLAHVNCALHARVLMRRGVDYLVRHGAIEMIDEWTGRVVADRRWPEGLHAAIEAKEGLTSRPQGDVWASITLQRFMRRYPTLAGMTGTARTVAVELTESYGCRVVVVPPHQPVQRIERPDLVFTHREAKERALVAEVARQHVRGRPILVGTATVEESDRLATAVRRAGVPCDVLNAEHDAEEAALVARAGHAGAVVVATNLAGRGTDILLGDGTAAGRQAVAALGGLLVIGANRHESRRIDRQLAGRAGRQGDPGESCVLTSLEDDLLVRHGGLGRLLPAGSVPTRQDGPVDHPVVLREVARAQRIIEGQHREVRRTLAKYAAVVEDQFELVVAERWRLLDGDDDWPRLWREGGAPYERLRARVGVEALEAAERRTRVEAIDRVWRAHLARAADVREGAHLATLGGRDPLDYFASTAVADFEGFGDAVDASVRAALDRVRVVDGRVDLSDVVPPTPATTWTYLVNDDPFQRTMGTLLTGPGGQTVAIYAAALLAPLLVAWGAVSRWGQRK